MPISGESVRPSLRKILAYSHVSVVAIAVLLFWSLDSAVLALWGPLSRAASFLFTAVLILDIPYFSHSLTTADRFLFFLTYSYFFNSFVYMAAAAILSHWVHGMGPFRFLIKYSTRLARRNHV
jgi:hypothetical protein